MVVPQLKQLGKFHVGNQEKALYVTFKPLEWEEGSEFCIALRIMASVPQERGKTQIRELSLSLSLSLSPPFISISLSPEGVGSLSVMHWSYLKSAGYTITPEPGQMMSSSSIAMSVMYHR